MPRYFREFKNAGLATKNLACTGKLDQISTPVLSFRLLVMVDYG